ncbi:hypothetical protein [Nodosilinea nodulosa]|uniref:hypothetical protein n=1 Tax=Nodosilinea nodulosa TaxID=416001 RepID=UPI0003134E9C|nr:hypothetical protein [Nodosilinea nodulosa]
MKVSTHPIILGSALGVISALMSPGLVTYAQSADIDDFCARYAENSRCENQEPSSPPAGETVALPEQVIQVRLDTSGPDDEFIWIAIRRNAVNLTTELTAYHAQKIDSSLNQILGGAIGAVAVPIPGSLFDIHSFQDQQTEYLAFTSDTCQSQLPIANGQGFRDADCAISGNGHINLPEEADIRAGFFTLGYTENNLVKAVIFRLDDQNAVFVGDADLAALCQSFPLNSRCRYWPLSSSSR